MNRLYPAVITVLILSLQACASLPLGSSWELREAQSRFDERKYGEAVSAYRKVIRENPGTSAAAEARFNLGLTLAWYDNPQRDYGAAHQEFDEFLRIFPDHRLAPEARNWRHLLKTVDDMKKSLDQLKKLDLRHEERRKRR